jgi:hypothetical protein
MTTEPFHVRSLVPNSEAQVEQFRAQSAAALDWLEPLRYGSDLAQEVLVARPRGPRYLEGDGRSMASCSAAMGGPLNPGITPS